MTLKDISFAGFFKIFCSVQAVIFLLTSLIGLMAHITNPELVTISQSKLLGLLTLDMGGNNAPIMLFILGVINVFFTSASYALIAMIISKLPPIGRIKIADTGYGEQVFD